MRVVGAYTANLYKNEVIVVFFSSFEVIVDSKLGFHEHVRILVGKCGEMSELLRSTVCRGMDFMVTLFISHIRPVIEYCSCVLNVGFVGDVRLVESLQRRYSPLIFTYEADGS